MHHFEGFTARSNLERTLARTTTANGRADAATSAHIN